MPEARPMPDLNRIGLLVHNLQSGGAQRVMSILANGWAAQGLEVHLYTLDGPGTAPFFRLDPRVGLHPLGLSSRSRGVVQKVTRNLARIRNLRRALARNRLDVLLSFIDRTNILALLGSRGLGVPVVVSERVDPASHEVGWIWNMLRTLTYPLADGLVVQVPRSR